MITALSSEPTLEQSLEGANRLASHLLRSSLGAHTSEDVVSRFIEKELRAGKSETEINAILNKPGLYKRLDHIKNDIFRWETAKKRGGREPRVSFEEAEPILLQTMGDPESELIRKEDVAHMNDMLNWLISKADLSETQLMILHLDREGFTNEEIARGMGVDVEVVYARRSEAVRKLALAAARYISKDKK